MTFAIIRGSNGRRHEVDFGDDPVAIDISASDAVVQIVVEEAGEAASVDKPRYAMLSVPREQLMTALGTALRGKPAQGRPPRPMLVSDDER
jgi:hypothetical protein